MNCQQFNSLKVRLILSAVLMICLVLPLIGITLSNAFEQKLKRSIKHELSAYIYSILAVAEVEEQALFIPEQLAENQFNVSESGLYALVTNSRKTQKSSDFLQDIAPDRSKPLSILWQSASLLAMTPPAHIPTPDIGANHFAFVNVEKESHFIYSYSVSFSSSVTEQGKADFPVTIHIIKNKQDFIAQVTQFQQTLWLWLLFLMSLLVIIQVFWLKWTLKPLKVLQSELHRIEQGRLDQLEAQYPIELTQVTNQLNLLLKTEQGQRQRYRNALADLAHSLKTPLAVIQSQGGLSQSGLQQIDTINNIIQHQLKRAQSAGESSWHLGININSVLKKLLGSLAKIYVEKDLQWINNCQKDAVFKGDEADLLEILGNLLDNASKAATRQVCITVTSNAAQLLIQIEDDGKGIKPSVRDTIMQRGVRADTYQQGHGIGLAIVRDLVSSYQGEITIGESTELTGAQFNLLFRYQ